MTNTHLAVMQYAVPPRLDLVAAGDYPFCYSALARHIGRHPEIVAEYSDDAPDSGGKPLVLFDSHAINNLKEDELRQLLLHDPVLSAVFKLGYATAQNEVLIAAGELAPEEPPTPVGEIHDHSEGVFTCPADNCDWPSPDESTPEDEEPQRE